MSPSRLTMYEREFTDTLKSKVAMCVTINAECGCKCGLPCKLVKCMQGFKYGNSFMHLDGVLYTHMATDLHSFVFIKIKIDILTGPGRFSFHD